MSPFTPGRPRWRGKVAAPPQMALPYAHFSRRGPGGRDVTQQSDAIPVRLRDDGRTATWNPAITRAGQVLLQVRRADGIVETRRSLNSGRARVREGELIESVRPAQD